MQYIINKDGKTIHLLYGSDQLVVMEGTIEEIKKFLSRFADKYNYGLTRTWKQDDIIYVDCGPRVFHYQGEKDEEI